MSMSSWQSNAFPRESACIMQTYIRRLFLGSYRVDTVPANRALESGTNLRLYNASSFNIDRKSNSRRLKFQRQSKTDFLKSTIKWGVLHWLGFHWLSITLHYSTHDTDSLFCTDRCFEISSQSLKLKPWQFYLKQFSVLCTQFLTLHLSAIESPEGSTRTKNQCSIISIYLPANAHNLLLTLWSIEVQHDWGHWW